MSESQRDAGLVRALGPWSLAASLITIIVGAGIFVVPAALAAYMGPYGPLAFLVCGVAVGAVGVCFAEGGSRVPTSGGAYGYIEAAFGPLTGYVAGTMLWVADVLACGGVAAALADTVVSVLPMSWRTPAHAAVIVGVIGGITLINLKGVTQGARLINLMMVLKLMPLAVFLCVGAFGMHRANFAEPMTPGTRELGRAMILALFVLTGMETALNASGEVKDPARTIPSALALALLSVTALFIGIQVVAQGILGTGLPFSKTPLADAMARMSPALSAVMLAGAGVSMLGFISGAILSTPRVLFAFGRDGLLPRVLGRVDKRTHVPYVAILCFVAIAAALALTGTFAELAVLATLAACVVYIGGCAAAWRLARKGVAEAGTPLNFRWLGTAMVIGIASMLAMIALATRAEILGLLGLVGAAVALHALQARLGPEKRGAETPVI